MTSVPHYWLDPHLHTASIIPPPTSHPLIPWLKKSFLYVFIILINSNLTHKHHLPGWKRSYIGTGCKQDVFCVSWWEFKDYFMTVGTYLFDYLFVFYHLPQRRWSPRRHRRSERWPSDWSEHSFLPAAAASQSRPGEQTSRYCLPPHPSVAWYRSQPREPRPSFSPFTHFVSEAQSVGWTITITYNRAVLFLSRDRASGLADDFQSREITSLPVDIL